MRQVLLFVTALLCSTLSFAQNYWRPHTDGARITPDKAVSRLAFPAEYKLFDLDVTPLQSQVFRAVGNTNAHATVISLPNADGQIEQFEIVEASNFEPALQAKFPDIRAFSGKGITDKSAILKLSISPQGIQTTVFRVEKETEFIEPYSADHTVYTVFRKQAKSLPWKCSTPEQKLATDLSNNVVARSTGDLKTLRLAQSVTAEYSNYFGATSSSQVALVLAAVNATLTRCNGVYEKDLALHLNLVASSTNVFYYNASTDPYSNASTGAAGNWNGELQSTLTSVIGAANYDIGHLFGASGGGGNAGCIGCICVDASKGSGFTSPADGIPQGDNFDVDYVVHEVGHQLGANHTFSYGNEGTGVNVEPGSGITIMGYAGITSYDLAPHSIDIYHAVSINQIQTNLSSKTCPVTTSISANNATPVVSGGGSYTIPISTPFALTGSATDANAGDALTYCWEQIDNASTSQTNASSVASATKASGPNWISFAPTTSPTRLFPKLATILAGSLVSGPLTGGDASANTEALSSVARTLHFRLTVRDNSPYSSTAPVKVGQTNYADVTVTVSSAAGPFAVTAPNTAVSWAGNSSQTITWNVASTTASPVSTANVKISLSTDGGNTFSALVASTPNDGSEVVTIPNTPTTTARIKVEAVGNIFFDISNTNFTITAGSGCAAPTGLTSSSVTTTSASIGWTAVSGAASYKVDYKAASSSTWISAATATTATSVALTGLTQGTTYDYRVRTTCSSDTSVYSSAQFTTISTDSCNVPTALTSSSVTATGATVSWTAASGAVSYSVDYKLNTSSTWTSAATATSATSVTLSGLTAASLYDWRVRTNCASGSGSYIAAQFTTLTASGCANTLDNSTNGTLSGAATIPFNTDVTGLISPSGDVDYYKFVITTSGTVTITLGTLPGDYDLKLFNSSGTQQAISQASGTTSESISGTISAGTYYAQVYGYNGANSATSCYTLRVALGTATRSGAISGDLDKIQIYPNPAKNVVNVNLAGVKGKSEVSMYDVNGRQVLRREVSAVNAQLDISTLPTGVYIIKVKNGITEVSTTKIIKQ
ncbi:reprolysin-like metallopeptidase [Chitinophaga sancti]|uniref:Por secretion system C-terminal sorting domain-containing protein n=1 Tax=Chitinophaga sancti TaxID=1004 RepID=A0A1K1SX86_9BACT|nr:zinc-dependent metalloprotease family protein [Chitinophaga sancti]WQD62272.1 zinc-dependent metalloprotease family protein [Chitinophaga sancti]WQG92159.1 zinc-dependent metalloprotease family protein [Chitinophaga sancti]SFW88938.1 Por secretion system C-terminal sorting domain-containing protein [Chitinophaga sancti]